MNIHYAPLLFLMEAKEKCLNGTKMDIIKISMHYYEFHIAVHGIVALVLYL